MSYRVDVEFKTKGPVDEWAQGNLVKSDQGRIVLITGRGGNDDTFAGVSIVDPKRVGDYSPTWVKNAFTPFVGKLTIESE